MGDVLLGVVRVLVVAVLLGVAAAFERRTDALSGTPARRGLGVLTEPVGC